MVMNRKPEIRKSPSLGRALCPPASAACPALLLAAISLLACAVSAHASVVYNDGKYHRITTRLRTIVEVDEDTPSAATTVELADGGSIFARLAAYGDARITISGGIVEGVCYAYENSSITMTGGQIERDIHLRDNSTLLFTGGTIGQDITLYDDAVAEITGGRILGEITPWRGAKVTISGGFLAGQIRPVADALVFIHGTDFAINGVPVPLGTSASLYDTHATLSGTLANGDALSVEYWLIGTDCDILLVPEPASLLLLALGTLALRRRP